MTIEKIRGIRNVLEKKYAKVSFLHTFHDEDGEKYFVWNVGEDHEKITVAERWKPEKILAYIEINKLKERPKGLRHYKMIVFMKCMVAGVIPTDVSMYHEFTYSQMRQMLKENQVIA